ncbi:MAG: ATP-binding protein, partial [Lachnospiraceae bacterium]|nr:ATP-binding protein [Lachnospiraceae bacterium]
MKLKKLAIANYRQFSNAVINFDDELTILAGANNSGKTSIIELFKRLFRDRNFTKEDISAGYYSKLQHNFISDIDKIYGISLDETEFRENIKKKFSLDDKNKWTAVKIE